MTDKLLSDSYVIYNAYSAQLKTLYDDFSAELITANGNPEQEAAIKATFVAKVGFARKGRDLALAALPPDPNPAK